MPQNEKTPISGTNKKIFTNTTVSSPDMTDDEDDFPKKTPRRVRNFIESDSENESDEFRVPQSSGTPKSSEKSPEDDVLLRTPREIKKIIESDSEDESDEFQLPQSSARTKINEKSPKGQHMINNKDDVLLRTPREVNSIIESDSEDESCNEVISSNSESELSLHSIENIESDTDVNLGAIPKNVIESNRKSHHRESWNPNDIISSTQYNNTHIKTNEIANTKKSPTKNNTNLIEISSGDEASEKPTVIKRQSNLDTLFKQMSVKKSESSEFIEVSNMEYQAQKRRVAELHVDLQKAKNILRTVNLAALPDKGALLVKRHETGMETLKKEEERLRLMKVTKGEYIFLICSSNKQSFDLLS